MGGGKFEKKNRPGAAKPREDKTTGKKEKSKKKVLLRVAIIILAILLVLLVVAAVAMNYVFGKIGRYDETEPRETQDNQVLYETDPTDEGFTGESMNPEDIQFDEVDVLEDKNIINILLIGNDTQYEWEYGRADTIILVSLNKSNNSVQLTSFMRDLYVQIPGYLDNKINASFRFGGPELLNATLEKNFGIVVDGNVEVNFESFVKVIDILGGVEVDVSDEEKWACANDFGVAVDAGLTKLNGEQALAYSRIRHISGGDYNRSERQREVIAAVIQSVKDSDIATIMELIDKVLPYVTTNLTDAEIINYATVGLGVLANGAEISSMRIPADDAHYGTMISGMSVLVPDLGMCQEDLKDFIYGG